MSHAREIATGKPEENSLPDLKALGIEYLVGLPTLSSSIASAGDPHIILTQIASQSEPRIRDSIISLLLLHPTWATVILDKQRFSPEIAKRLTILLLAALYLQEQWYFQLSLAFGHAPEIPEKPYKHLWQAWSLPAPWIGYGVPGLVALERAEQQRTGQPWTFAGDWNNQVDHLIQQERQSKPTLPNTLKAVTSFLPPRPSMCEEPTEQELPAESQPHITRERIEHFLDTLGAMLREPTQITLGTSISLVWLGVLPASYTLDLALGWGTEAPASTVPTRELERALTQFREHSQWEVFWPGMLIPLPHGWPERAQYVGRFGQLKAFTSDPVSIALAALARGTSQDFATVLELIKRRFFPLDQLVADYHNIVTRFAQARLISRPDSMVIETNLTAVEEWIQGRHQ